MASRSLVRRLAPGLLLAVLPGCAVQLGTRAAQTAGSLDVRLLSLHPHDTFARVQVSRPAYVALFDVRPGATVRLLHPWNDRVSRRLSAGTRSLEVTPFHSSSYYDTHRVLFPEPQLGYLVVIAADDPLDLRSLRGEVERGGLLAYRGRWFARGSPFAVMDRLAAALVADRPAGSWAMDYVAYWDVPPGWAFASRLERPRRVRPLAPGAYRPERPAPDAPPAPPSEGERRPPRGPEIQPPVEGGEEEPGAPEGPLPAPPSPPEPGAPAEPADPVIARPAPPVLDRPDLPVTPAPERELQRERRAVPERETRREPPAPSQRAPRPDRGASRPVYAPPPIPHATPVVREPQPATGAGGKREAPIE